MVWRVTLPDYPDNIEYRPKEGAIRSPNEVGPANKRPRYTDEGAILSYRQSYSGAQYLDLLDFHDNELGQGSLTFTRDDPMDGVVKTMRFMARPSGTLSPGFGGPTAANRRWQVQIQLEIITLNV